MDRKDRRRLKRLKAKKFKLVYKGTGLPVGLSGPGGGPACIDEDIYEWVGTEAEWQEYEILQKQEDKEWLEQLHVKATNNVDAFREVLAKSLYGEGYEEK